MCPFRADGGPAVSSSLPQKGPAGIRIKNPAGRMGFPSGSTLKGGGASERESRGRNQGGGGAGTALPVWRFEHEPGYHFPKGLTALKDLAVAAVLHRYGENAAALAPAKVIVYSGCASGIEVDYCGLPGAGTHPSGNQPIFLAALKAFFVTRASMVEM
jgi:hypothetical protein